MKRIPTQMLLAVLVLALVAGIAAAHPSARAANTRQDRIALQRERIAVRLINEATGRVRRAHPRCRPSFRPSRPTLSDARPSDALLNAIGVLRRPATDADRIDLRSLLFPFVDGIYENWVRSATAADGRRFFVVAAQSRMLPAPIPRSCLTLEHTLLRQLLTHRGSAVSRVTLRLDARLDREEHPKGGFKPEEAIFLFDRMPDGRLGGGGGGGDLASFHRYGDFFSSGGGSRSAVAGLVPDGVARVEMTFGRAVSRGPHRDPKAYPKAIHLAEQVQDNVVAFDVDRPAEDAFPTRMTWLRADGTVLRVVRSPNG